MQKIVVAAAISAALVLGLLFLRHQHAGLATVATPEPAVSEPVVAPAPKAKHEKKAKPKAAPKQESCSLIPPLAFCDQVRWAKSCYSRAELEQMKKDYPDQAKKAKACK